MQSSQLALDDLTELIIGCAMTVHSTLGPGLLESVYRDCLVIELTMRGIRVEVEVRVPIIYRGRRVRNDLKVDLRVDGRVVVEAKAAERLQPVHLAQVITYLNSPTVPLDSC
jgi:GxxExxY protein